MSDQIPVDNKGFTLVELVFVITILTIVIGVAYQGIQQTLVTKKFLEERRQTNAFLGSILSRFNVEFQGMEKSLPLLRAMKVHPGSWSKIYFMGDKESIFFIIRNHGSKTPLSQIGYFVELDENREKTLYREVVPYKRPYDEAYKEAVKVALYHGIEDVEFLFSDKNVWSKEWGTPVLNDIPTQIYYKISVITPSGGIRTLESTVALKK
jgi:prepilin-type N-terminal cleavage/methylation domain-containing protein